MIRSFIVPQPIQRLTLKYVSVARPCKIEDSPITQATIFLPPKIILPSPWIFGDSNLDDAAP
jgi:hypothetical protein